MKNKVLQFIPLVVFFGIWEITAYFNTNISTLFSSPSKIILLLYNKIVDLDLLYHIYITGIEAFSGLVLGLLVGCVIGFILVYFPKYSRYSYPYLVALSSIPTFALAPLMIIWFGTGLQMKIILSFLATVFTTIFQTYQGASNISKSDSIFFKINGATNKQRFWMLAFPASIDWVIQSLKINSSACVLGAFIGEFIASEAGLGYIILKASGLYDTTYVFVAIICIIILTMLFNIIASTIANYKMQIIRFMVLKYNR